VKYLSPSLTAWERGVALTRVQAELGTNVREYLYGAGNAVLAEHANGGAWVVQSFGAWLYQRGNDYLHWSLRGDLAGIGASSANVPITDAFGDTVNGMRPVCALFALTPG